MEIQYVTGDATQPDGNGLQVIVHLCNDAGAWNKGFVTAVSRRWPEPERRYRTWHKHQEGVPFKLGQVQFVRTIPEIIIANVLAIHGTHQMDAEPPVRYYAIRQGLKRVAALALQHDASVHMPRIGCGQAGGEWEKVESIIREELCGLGIPVTVYDPQR